MCYYNLIKKYLCDDNKEFIPNIMEELSVSLPEATELAIRVFFKFFKENGSDFDFLTVGLNSPSTALFYPYKEKNEETGFYKNPDGVTVEVDKELDIEHLQVLKNEIGNEIRSFAEERIRRNEYFKKRIREHL